VCHHHSPDGKVQKSLAGLRRIMALNQIEGEHFSAIAASSNNTINSDVQKRRFALLLHAGYGER
jgi:hypothetical protein